MYDCLQHNGDDRSEKSSRRSHRRRLAAARTENLSSPQEFSKRSWKKSCLSCLYIFKYGGAPWRSRGVLHNLHFRSVSDYSNKGLFGLVIIWSNQKGSKVTVLPGKRILEIFKISGRKMLRGLSWDCSKDIERCHVTWWHMYVILRWLKVRTIQFLFNFCSKYWSRVKILGWHPSMSFWAISRYLP